RSGRDMMPVSTTATAAFLAGPAPPAGGAAPIRMTPVGTPPIPALPGVATARVAVAVTPASRRWTGRSDVTNATRGSRCRLARFSSGSVTTSALSEPNRESTVAPRPVARPATADDDVVPEQAGAAGRGAERHGHRGEEQHEHGHEPPAQHRPADLPLERHPPRLE